MNSEELFQKYRQGFLNYIYSGPRWPIPPDHTKIYKVLMRVAKKQGLIVKEFNDYNGNQSIAARYHPGAGIIEVYVKKGLYLCHEICHDIDHCASNDLIRKAASLDPKITEVVANPASWIFMSRVTEKELPFYGTIDYPKSIGVSLELLDASKPQILLVQDVLYKAYHEEKNKSLIIKIEDSILSFLCGITNVKVAGHKE